MQKNNIMRRGLEKSLGVPTDPELTKYSASVADFIKTNNIPALYGVAFGLTKEAYAHLDDTTASQVASDAIRQVTGRSGSSWDTGKQEHFADMVSQVRQPHGGTEMLTGVAQPGTPPARVQAEPGASGNYPKTAKPIGAPSDGFYDSQGRDTTDNGTYDLGYRSNPPNRVGNADAPRGTDSSPWHSAQYPEATHITSVKPRQTKPGNVHPKYAGWTTPGGLEVLKSISVEPTTDAQPKFTLHKTVESLNGQGLPVKRARVVMGITKSLSGMKTLKDEEEELDEALGRRQPRKLEENGDGFSIGSGYDADPKDGQGQYSGSTDTVDSTDEGDQLDTSESEAFADPYLLEESKKNYDQIARNFEKEALAFEKAGDWAQRDSLRKAAIEVRQEAMMRRGSIPRIVKLKKVVE